MKKNIFIQTLIVILFFVAGIKVSIAQQALQQANSRSDNGIKINENPTTKQGVPVKGNSQVKLKETKTEKLQLASPAPQQLNIDNNTKKAVEPLNKNEVPPVKKPKTTLTKKDTDK